MEIGLINKENLEYFKTLLLPETVSMLEQGQPVLAIGLTEKNIACGAAVGWLTGDVLEIHSLYVAPDYRRMGGGRLLVDTIEKLSEKLAVNLAVSFTVTLPEHETIVPFLTSIGFEENITDETIYQISVEAIGCSPFFHDNSSMAGTVSFEDISYVALNEAYRRAAAVGENYLEVPLTDASVDKRVSCAVMEGNRIRSFAAFTSNASDRITMAWVKNDKPQDLPVLLRSAFSKIMKFYTPDAYLTVQAVNAASAKLIAAIIPEAKVISHTLIRTVR